MERIVQLFIQGGPIMWPILILSLIASTVVLERFYFLLMEKVKSTPEKRAELLSFVEKGKITQAIQEGEGSSDYVIRVITYALKNREEGLTEAFMRAANQELLRFRRGLSVLDTAITLAPLLGLLGTVIGMIIAFGMVTGDLGAPTAITGGIAEALLATAFGLGVAIISLIPFNTLNASADKAQHILEDTGTHLELMMKKQVETKEDHTA